MTVSDWVQTAAVVVALGAALTALRVAAQDRRAQAHQARLALELQAAASLMEQVALYTVGGGGTEANAKMFAPVVILGQHRVPRLWDLIVGVADGSHRADPGLRLRDELPIWGAEVRTTLRALSEEQPAFGRPRA